MYIHRVVTKGVPGLPDQDLTFWDEFRQEPLHSVLLTGPNGSGKTTLLKVIAGLWDGFSYWLRDEGAKFSINMSPESARIATLGSRGVLRNAKAAAIEIRDLLPQPLWLWIRNGAQNPDWLTNKGISSNYNIGEMILDLGHTYSQPEVDRNLNASSLLNDLRMKQERLALGAIGRDQTLPNMLYVPTDNRSILEVNGSDNRIQPEPLYEWLITYQTSNNWNANIEGMLRNLKIRDPAWFDDTLRRINQYLETTGKSLTDFDDKLRLNVKITSTGEMYHLSGLSSGEQQFVILIFMVSRWLMDGGVMLIDEPDLYMHVSWQRALVRELKRLVAEKHGQLIITSHAEEVWDEFNFRQSFNLLEGKRESIFHESTDAK